MLIDRWRNSETKYLGTAESQPAWQWMCSCTFTWRGRQNYLLPICCTAGRTPQAVSQPVSPSWVLWSWGRRQQGSGQRSCSCGCLGVCYVLQMGSVAAIFVWYEALARSHKHLEHTCKHTAAGSVSICSDIFFSPVGIVFVFILCVCRQCRNP